MKLIGKGAYSSVWLAYDLRNEDFVAIKAIAHEDEDTATREVQFNRKLQNSKNLNIMLYYFADKDNTYMVFKLYGGSLYELYKYNDLDEKTIDRIFYMALDKLTELHQRFRSVHGDIKAESFMYYSKNPICEDFIKRFNELGGIKNYLAKTENNMTEALALLKHDLFQEEDYNSDLFSVYNSSNDSSSCSSSGYSSDSSDEKEIDAVGEKLDDVKLESDRDSYSSGSSITSLVLDYTLTQEELKNLKIDLIDYSHVHREDDDEDDIHFECTRYYRCLEALQGKDPPPYKVDWWALAVTFWEIENKKIWCDPQGDEDEKNQQQIEFIKENKHMLDKWLNKIPYFNKN
jgi:serine/threonine protein kinase